MPDRRVVDTGPLPAPEMTTDARCVDADNQGKPVPTERISKCAQREQRAAGLARTGKYLTRRGGAAARRRTAMNRSAFPTQCHDVIHSVHGRLRF